MHFGLIVSPVPGHLLPGCALGRALQHRGHRVTALQILDAKDEVERQGLRFAPLGADAFPAGSWARRWRPVREGWGPRAHAATLALHRALTDVMCRDVPALGRELGLDALLVDQLQPQGAALAEHLGIPFATFCTMLPLADDPRGIYPPVITPWRCAQGPLERAAYRVVHGAVAMASLPLLEVVNRYRRQWGRRARWRPSEHFSERVSVCAVPPSFELPCAAFGPTLHYTGPFLDEHAGEVPFPWQRLDGRPLVYVSLGTLRNRVARVFQAVATACATLDAQTVISLGAWQGDAPALDLSPAITVPYAPQRALLKRAAVCVSHGGANTVFEALAAGVPQVILPITDDQPANATRLVRTGAGLSVPIADATPARLREVIGRVLREDGFRRRATTLAAEVSALEGAAGAARRIEDALRRPRDEAAR